ncbi:hypothetical protein [Roseovarius sp. Pro17]|uniref:hypothetical protein n=1 Tax=Roseovarius sp. Pro17 TaxID=3108175 RepID=UPI002D77065E|nr:hypothetical protein [Roseovarius sp. Pro17]
MSSNLAAPTIFPSEIDNDIARTVCDVAMPLACCISAQLCRGEKIYNLRSLISTPRRAVRTQPLDKVQAIDEPRALNMPENNGFEIACAGSDALRWAVDML